MLLVLRHLHSETQVLSLLLTTFFPSRFVSIACFNWQKDYSIGRSIGVFHAYEFDGPEKPRSANSLDSIPLFKLILLPNYWFYFFCDDPNHRISFCAGQCGKNQRNCWIYWNCDTPTMSSVSWVSSEVSMETNLSSKPMTKILLLRPRWTAFFQKKRTFQHKQLGLRAFH